MIQATLEFGFPLLSEMLLIPLAAAIVCLCVSAGSARWVALIATLIELALGILLWTQYNLTAVAAPSGPKRSIVFSSPRFQNRRPSHRAGRTKTTS